jgi:hypothetical protein
MIHCWLPGVPRSDASRHATASCASAATGVRYYY